MCKIRSCSTMMSKEFVFLPWKQFTYLLIISLLVCFDSHQDLDKSGWMMYNVQEMNTPFICVVNVNGVKTTAVIVKMLGLSVFKAVLQRNL